MREIALPAFDKAILSDTVGFISDLPTQLVAAFRATLEEVISADLIVHVRDISHPDSDAQRADVEQVLDLLGGEEASGCRRRRRGARTSSRISALTGEGSTAARMRLGQARKGAKLRTVTLGASDGEAIAWLHANGEVESQRSTGVETVFEVRLSEADWARLQSRQRSSPAGRGPEAVPERPSPGSLDQLLRPLPERFQLIDIHSFNGLSANLFHLAEALLEARRGLAKGRFRVDVEVAGIIDDREQQVAELGGALLVGGGGVDLGQLLVDLGARPGDIGPVEADARGAALQLLGALEGGKGEGDSGQGALVLAAWRSAALSASQPGLSPASPKMCGMAADHLGADRRHDVIEAKAPISSAMRA
jgi:hypothetical protein